MSDDKRNQPPPGGVPFRSPGQTQIGGIPPGLLEKATAPRPAAPPRPMPVPEENQQTMMYGGPPPALRQPVAVQPAFAQPDTAPVHTRLDLVQGTANQKTYLLSGSELKLGRISYNEVVILNDKKVSRTHAKIYFENGKYFVEDLNSSNGVYVNDKMVYKLALRSGDKVSLGDTVFIFTQSQPDISLAQKLAFLEQCEQFNWLDANSRTLLAEHLAVRFTPRGQVVLRQNMPVESMFLLYSGVIRIALINEEGGERVVGELQPGEFFGERALLAGEVSKYSMIASTDLFLLELGGAQLRDLLQRRPELDKVFYRMVLNKVSATSSFAVTGGAKEERAPIRGQTTPTDVELIGENPKIRDAKKKIEALAQAERPVLIIGMAGTGKKTFARYHHKCGRHAQSSYVEISVAEMEASKVGPAIFGVDAETPGGKPQVGYLEMIDDGTLTIAHVEMLDVHQQSKLLVYLRQGWFHRSYGREAVQSKARVALTATGTQAEVEQKMIPELREFFRDGTIVAPNLADRLKDVPLLVDHFLKVFSRNSGKNLSGLSHEAVEKLVAYNWPGNVKELENVVQRAAIVSAADKIIPGDLIFVAPSEKEIHKANILRKDLFRVFLQKRWVPGLFVWMNVLVVLGIMALTLYGGLQEPGHPLSTRENNPGMLITWLIWFPLLPISAFLLGRIWCGVCPIAGIGEAIAKVVHFNLPVPKWMKKTGLWIVIFAFLFLDFTEELFGVADEPFATGMLLVIIIGSGTFFFILFERNTFCRYVCPLAGLLGGYSSLSIVEVRGNKSVCQAQCGHYHCYKGSEKAKGCPMFSYPANMTANVECMMCFKCVKNCDNRGVQVNLRPPLQELWQQPKPDFAMSLFALMLVGMMGRHQFGKLTWWQTLEPTLQWGEFAIMTVQFLAFLSLALVPFLFCAVLSAAASQEKVTENMAHYGIAFIPLAFAGHLAHLLFEFMPEGLYSLLNYLNRCWFSLTTGVFNPELTVEFTFVQEPVITFCKFVIISAGAFGTFIALIMIARRLLDRNVLGRIMPYLLLLAFFFVGYVFIFLGNTEAPAPGPEAPAVTAPAGGEAAPAANTAPPPAEPAPQPAQPAPAGDGTQPAATP